MKRIPDMKRIKVMIVDDEPVFQELVLLVLSLDPKFEVVRIAGTGEEALSAFEDADPDLVLLDFRMPGIDGLETARRMKEQSPNTKIAMVTAHTEQILGRLAREARIHEVIPKASFNLERVQQLLEPTS